MTDYLHNPILITGAERSGSTFIARILDMCGVWSGNCNNMFENEMITSLHSTFMKYEGSLFPPTRCLYVPMDWRNMVHKILEDEDWHDGAWMVKSSLLAQYWPTWYYTYPDAKWVIVRRRTADVVQSCLKTGYMKLFKNKCNLGQLKLTEERDGWLWWIHQYEKKFVEMIEEGLNCRVIWPDRMAEGDFSQVKETVEWLGLEWNNKIPEVILPLLEKSRREE
jgi:hypothetical protein